MRDRRLQIEPRATNLHTPTAHSLAGIDLERTLRARVVVCNLPPGIGNAWPPNLRGRNQPHPAGKQRSNNAYTTTNQMLDAL